MSKSPAAPLSIPGMPRKGDASPAMVSLEDSSPSASTKTAQLTPAVSLPTPAINSPSPRLTSRVQATIAVTVRLDERRYERMKGWGTNRRVTNQEVIVAALDQFFELSDDAREDGIAAVRR
jgi:hypothetical protein